MDGAIDMARLRKVWLVKVPNAVAQTWAPLCAAAMNPSNLDEDAPPIELGTVVLNAEESEGVTLVTPGAQPGEQRCFHLKQVHPPAGSAMIALSYKTDGQTDVLCDTSNGFVAEGAVDASFNAVPVVQGDEVDPAYRQMNRERVAKHSVKTRTIQSYNANTRESALREIIGNKGQTLESKRKAEAERKAREDAAKRTRMDEAQLERALFELFEKQPRWTIPKLAEATKQVPSYMRGVLEKIAVINKRGPYKDTYQLKKEYQLNEIEGEGQQ